MPITHFQSLAYFMMAFTVIAFAIASASVYRELRQEDRKAAWSSLLWAGGLGVWLDAIALDMVPHSASDFQGPNDRFMFGFAWLNPIGFLLIVAGTFLRLERSPKSES